MLGIDMVLTLSLVTFGLVSLWMYQTKREAEEGLPRKQAARVRTDNSRRN